MLTRVDPTLDRQVILFQDVVPSTAPVNHHSTHAPEFESNERIPLKDFTFLLQYDCFETSYGQKITCEKESTGRL